MKTFFLSVALGAGILLSAGVSADTPPAGAIAQCKDGTYFSGTSHNGACKGHQGVKEWLDKNKAAPAAAAPAAAAPKPSSSTRSSSTTTSASTAASDTSSKKTKSSKTTADTSGSATSSKKSKSTKTESSTAASATAGPIAKCKDGTTYNGTSHKGACRGHKGVAEWLDQGSSAAAATPAAKATPATAPAATAAPAAAPKPTTAPAAVPATSTAATPASAPAAATTRTPPTPASQITQKAGGGPGLVWVNTDSKVYHCQGDEWYGKTKEGSYMSEAAAKTAGNHAAHGKECTQ